MRPRTSKKNKNADTQSTTTTGSGQSTKIELPSSDSKPPILTILPKNISSDARIVNLPSTAPNKAASRYLVCPQNGFFEFLSIGDTAGSKSWLLTPDSDDSKDAGKINASDSNGYLLKSPDILIATPIDPIFIVLPFMLLADQSTYQTCVDYIFGNEDAALSDLQRLLKQPCFVEQLNVLELRMAEISEMIRLGDDEDAMYRLFVPKLGGTLTQKASKMAMNGLPSSMEDHFVRQALEKPAIMTKKDEAELIAEETGQQQSQTSDPVSQQSTISSATNDSATTAATSVSSASEAQDGRHNLKHLQRIKIAYEYMLKAYIPLSLHAQLSDHLLSRQSQIDFKPLLTLHKEIEDLKIQTQALRALSDNISRKRAVDDDEAAEKAAEKKRKREEEEIKKKNVSQGVKKLLKADTSGMKKLSSFFTKKS